jgi:hypothetical protein
MVCVGFPGEMEKAYGRRYRVLTAREIQLINKRVKPTIKGMCRWFRQRT